MGYFGTPWITLNEELPGQMSACLNRTYISVIHITYEEIQTSSHKNQPVEKDVENFQRNAQDSHLVFQNEAYFNCREAYLPMKISCKYCEASWSSFPLRVLTPKNLSTRGGGGGANTKQKYPPNASGGYSKHW